MLSWSTGKAAVLLKVFEGQGLQPWPHTTKDELHLMQISDAADLLICGCHYIGFVYVPIRLHQNCKGRPVVCIWVQFSTVVVWVIAGPPFKVLDPTASRFMCYIPYRFRQLDLSTGKPPLVADLCSLSIFSFFVLTRQLWSLGLRLQPGSRFQSSSASWIFIASKCLQADTNTSRDVH